jgi:hypothetical protein
MYSRSPFARLGAASLHRVAAKEGQARKHYCKVTTTEESEAMHVAYNALQEFFACEHMLHHANYDRPIYIDIDASK